MLIRFWREMIGTIPPSKRNKDINKLFELVQNYKSDLNFLNYFKFKKERTQIELCKKLIKRFIKSNKNFSNQNEKILDILWFLDYELINRVKFVKQFIGNKFSNQSLIFFKTWMF